MPDLDLKTTTAQELSRILIELCGEENVNPGVLEDGDPFVATWFQGTPLMLCVESLGGEPVFINARHTLGVEIQSATKAYSYTARRNQDLRLGRLELCGTEVHFSFQLFAANLNKETIRWVLRLLISEAATYTELAETTGALKLTDFLALQQAQEE